MTCLGRGAVRGWGPTGGGEKRSKKQELLALYMFAISAIFCVVNGGNFLKISLEVPWNARGQCLWGGWWDVFQDC